MVRSFKSNSYPLLSRSSELVWGVTRQRAIWSTIGGSWGKVGGMGSISHSPFLQWSHPVIQIISSLWSLCCSGHTADTARLMLCDTTTDVVGSMASISGSFALCVMFWWFEISLSPFNGSTGATAVLTLLDNHLFYLSARNEWNWSRLQPTLWIDQRRTPRLSCEVASLIAFLCAMRICWLLSQDYTQTTGILPVYSVTFGEIGWSSWVVLGLWVWDRVPCLHFLLVAGMFHDTMGSGMSTCVHMNKLVCATDCTDLALHKRNQYMFRQLWMSINIYDFTGNKMIIYNYN